MFVQVRYVAAPVAPRATCAILDCLIIITAVIIIINNINIIIIINGTHRL